MEIHAMVNREFNFVLPILPAAATVGVHVPDKRGSHHINGIRQGFPAAHDNGDIGMVAFPGQRERAVYIDNHAGDVVQDPTCNRVVRELPPAFIGPTVSWKRPIPILKISNTPIMMRPLFQSERRSARPGRRGIIRTW